MPNKKNKHGNLATWITRATRCRPLSHTNTMLPKVGYFGRYASFRIGGENIC